MKTMITAIALMFLITANAGTPFAHEDDDHKSYEHNQSKDHAERNHREHDDEGHNRHTTSESDRNHAANGQNQAEAISERFMPDWWPF